MNDKAKKYVGANSTVNEGADYSDEECEFMVAIDRYKRDNHRPHPTWREVLEVLKGLGWRKPA